MNDITPTYNPEASIVLVTNPYTHGVRAPEEYTLDANTISLKLNRMNVLESGNTILSSNIESVRQYILEYAEENDTISDELSEIAELLSIDLDTEIEIEMTISYTATISVPFGKKVSSDDFEISINYNSEGEALYDDYTVDSFDNGTY